jgi:hypothetical protein
MPNALRRRAVALKRAATLDCAAEDYPADPMIIKLMLESAAELEAEADCVEQDTSTCRPVGPR